MAVGDTRDKLHRATSQFPRTKKPARSSQPDSDRRTSAPIFSDFTRAASTKRTTSTPKSEIPLALRKVVAATPTGEVKNLHLQKLSPSKIFRAISHAHSWMAKNYKIDIGSKCYYYLYGLERYKSFQEAMEGLEDISPQWYNDGYEFLAKSQAADGSWTGYCGQECDTAFSVLFLLRSTQNEHQGEIGRRHAA